MAVVVLLGAAAALGCDRPGDAGAPPRTGVLVVDVVTGDLDRVARAPGDLAWSSGGRWLYRSGEPSGLNDPVRRFDTIGRAGRRRARLVLDAPATGYGDVAVAPDGRRIAYVGEPSDPRQENFGDLVVATSTGQRRTQLLPRALGTPAWSPTGSRVAVLQASVADSRGDRGAAPRLVVAPIQGSGRPQTVGRWVSDTPSLDNPRWLRDGRLLVALRHGGRGDLVTMRPNGRRRQVIARAIRAFGWAPSPDNRRLAIAGLVGGDVQQHLYVVDLAGGPLRRISDETIADVTWSPSGERLAAISGDRILLIDPDGDRPPQVLVRVARRQLVDLAWSPDGRRLAFSATVPPPPGD